MANGFGQSDSINNIDLVHPLPQASCASVLRGLDPHAASNVVAVVLRLREKYGDGTVDILNTISRLGENARHLATDPDPRKSLCMAFWPDHPRT